MQQPKRKKCESQHLKDVMVYQIQIVLYPGDLLSFAGKLTKFAAILQLDFTFKVNPQIYVVCFSETLNCSELITCGLPLPSL